MMMPLWQVFNFLWFHELLLTLLNFTGVQFKKVGRTTYLSLIGRELLSFNKGTLGKEKDSKVPPILGLISVSGITAAIGHYAFMDKAPGLESNRRQYNILQNETIMFVMSSVGKDAGQSYVPYFDGNEVTFDIKSPVKRISFIHYTNHDDYAGYIKPIVYPLDYRKHFSTKYEAPKFLFAEGITNFNSSIENDIED